MRLGKRARDWAAIVISVVSAIFAGGSLWYSLETFKLSQQESAEAAFVALNFETAECKVRVSMPNGDAVFQALELRAGENAWVGPRIYQTTEPIDLQPLMRHLFGPEEEEFLADVGRTQDVPGPGVWDLAETRSYDQFIPLLAIYDVERRGRHQRYYAVMGLRVNYWLTAERSGRTNVSRLTSGQPDCRGLVTLQRFSSEQAAEQAIREEWQNFRTNFGPYFTVHYDPVRARR